MKIPDQKAFTDLQVITDYMSGKNGELEMVFFCLEKAKKLVESLDDNDTGWDDEEAGVINEILKNLDSLKNGIDKSKIKANLPPDNTERLKMFHFKLDEGIQKNNAEQTLVWFLGIAKYFLSALETDSKNSLIQTLYVLAEELAKRCENFLIDVDIEKLQ